MYILLPWQLQGNLLGSYERKINFNPYDTREGGREERESKIEKRGRGTNFFPLQLVPVVPLPLQAKCTCISMFIWHGSKCPQQILPPYLYSQFLIFITVMNLTEKFQGTLEKVNHWSAHCWLDMICFGQSNVLYIYGPHLGVNQPRQIVSILVAKSWMILHSESIHVTSLPNVPNESCWKTHLRKYRACRQSQPQSVMDEDME